MVVDVDVDSVWNALPDYERLADFIPNHIFSARIPCVHPGRIWLEQIGLQRALYWHIKACVVLDLREFPNTVSRYWHIKAHVVGLLVFIYDYNYVLAY
ncbi:hypothetical protein L1887_34580 [Cichorium endivia]|nr:hypothetical protein L1887_34580 [Cichorium endivia]